MQRIVSLGAAATEIVCALGLESALVGRSHECDYPPSVRDLPALTLPASDSERARLDALREARPDVILIQADEHGVSPDEVQAALDTPAQLVTLEAKTLDGVLADIESVAAALDAADAGAELLLKLRARIHDIAARAEATSTRPTVACIAEIDPLTVFGYWLPELITMAGGQPLFGMTGRPSPWVEWDDLWAADPDRIILACRFDMERTLRELPALERLPGWESLRATREQQVYVTDGSVYRPGPRLVEGLEILGEIIHPDAFRFGHEGVGWVRR